MYGTTDNLMLVLAATACIVYAIAMLGHTSGAWSSYPRLTERLIVAALLVGLLVAVAVPAYCILRRLTAT